MNEIKIDNEFQVLIPTLSNDEFNQLKKNILEDGCRDALIIWNGILIDGHNRYKICTENGVKFKTIEMNFSNREEAIEWIIRNQFGRRNLLPYVRSQLALTLESVIKQKAKEKQIKEGKKLGGTLMQKSAEGVISTRKELAKLAGVSHDIIDKVKVIEREATTEQKQALLKGDKKVNTVYRELRPKKPMQESKGISEIKICTKCGKEKTLEYFYSGRNTCKDCSNKQRTNSNIKDVKGNIIKSSVEAEALSKQYADDIERELYNIDKIVEYNVDDMKEELDGLVNYFIRNIKDCLETRNTVLENDENKQKIKDILINTETEIEKIKGIFL